MMKWEYLVVGIHVGGNGDLALDGWSYLDPNPESPPTLLDILDDIGEGCWELVCVDRGDYTFKRPIP